MTEADVAVENIARWKRDPVQMALELFDFTPDRWQAQVLRAFPDPARPRLAMQACAGPGKTAVEALCGWNFLLCYSDGVNHPNGAVMSVTADNLKNNLWKELAVWRARAPALVAGFEMTAETIFFREAPKTWFLSARSWSKTANPEEQGRTLSGLHAKSILYLIDEAGDISPSVLQSAEQGLANCAWGKIVVAGNPTSHQGLLHQAVSEQSHLWTVVRITGDPEDPNRSPRIDIEWAREQIKLYGRDNPWVMAYILGKFPPTSLNALLGPDEMRAAMGRHLSEDVYEFAQKRIGTDIARFGDDATVMFPRQGLAAFNPVEMRNARTEEIAGRLMEAKHTWSSELELIDDSGNQAGGVIDACRLGGVTVLPVYFSGKPDDPRYFNKRTEINFRAADWVKNGGALPNIPRLIREACAVTYYFHEGKLRVTEKEQIKKDLSGVSPDYWDALCITFALVEMPSQAHRSLTGAGAGHVVSEYDPYAEER